MTARRRARPRPSLFGQPRPGLRRPRRGARRSSCEVEVEETGEFGVEADEALPARRSNLCVRSFERLHSADGIAFRIRSEIPLARGLGSSAAAIVAGLLAADHMFELGLSPDELYAHAVELEGHPDNVGAALYGGFVVCPQPDAERTARARADRAAPRRRGRARDP